jgi:hypothetical protein
LWGAAQGPETSVHWEAGPDGGCVGDLFLRWGRGDDQASKVVDPEASIRPAVSWITRVGPGLM